MFDDQRELLRVHLMAQLLPYRYEPGSTRRIYLIQYNSVINAIVFVLYLYHQHTYNAYLYCCVDAKHKCNCYQSNKDVIAQNDVIFETTPIVAYVLPKYAFSEVHLTYITGYLYEKVDFQFKMQCKHVI